MEDPTPDRTGMAHVEAIPVASATALDWLESHRDVVTGLCDRIWRFAEPGMREYESSALLVDFLRREGYDVETGVSGMPTAFIGTYARGTGPTIGLFCEYDATPGDSQHAVPRPSPISADACGFPDLHNGIGAASAAAAASIARAMEANDVNGTVRIFGTPAEKLCVGKPFLARDGSFDDLDAVVAWHPRPYTTVEWEGGPGCYRAEIFDFWGTSAYGATPWAGVSALDVMSIMNVIVQFMREHIPRGQLVTINELVTVGGQHPTSLPPHAQVWYVMRSPVREGIDTASGMLGRAAEAACLATGARFERRTVAATRPWLPNHVLARACYRSMERIGPPSFAPASKDFARQQLRELGITDDPEPFDEALSSPESGVTVDRAGGTDDVSEFCWHAPTARIYVAHGPRVGRLPNWVGAALSGTEAAHVTVMSAASYVASSTLELLGNPDIVADARAEFEQRTAGLETEPLLDASARPPVDESFPPHYPRGWRPPADRDQGPPD